MALTTGLAGIGAAGGESDPGVGDPEVKRGAAGNGIDLAAAALDFAAVALTVTGAGARLLNDKCSS